MKTDEFDKVIKSSLQIEKDLEDSFTLEEMEEIQKHKEDREDYSYNAKKALSIAILTKTLNGVHKNIDAVEKSTSIMRNAIKTSDPVSFIIIGVMNIAGMTGLLALLSY